MCIADHGTEGIKAFQKERFNTEPLRALASRLEVEALTASDADLQACNALLQKEFVRAKELLTDPSVMPGAIRAAS